ncbi:shikimate dehydrogenase [Limnohabitans sp. 2KL-51]|uniref:shikimate dehydrogenase n=1 Tax=Limnohabitans sp. 2KL-51 TaxID=1977911 RepID=UPI000D39AA80|nr:shikimate dehydrogenase [Limnohabitans sp. 2KL-51]PUE51208.1 shikimate dehydrogenase [Limnohabitans sp. 2KL-51]
MTDRYAVIGNPIVQSKSPMIHSAFAQVTGQDIDYGKLLGPLGEFTATVDAFRASGGRGMNVTAPFKLDAFAYATDLAPSAQMAGAVNAMKFEGDKVYAENFDGVGLLRDVVQNLSCPLQGRRVLILGAGGATRGALLPLLAEQPAELVIVNRTLAKAQELAALAQQHQTGQVPVQGLGYDAVQGAFDVVLNASSSSLTAELPPLPASVFAPGCLAYDLTYGKGLTPFLKLAHQAGVTRLADGVGMLAEQAAEAFAWWRGVRPDTAAVIAQLTVPLV